MIVYISQLYLVKGNLEKSSYKFHLPGNLNVYVLFKLDLFSRLERFLPSLLAPIGLVEANAAELKQLNLANSPAVFLPIRLHSGELHYSMTSPVLSRTRPDGIFTAVSYLTSTALDPGKIYYKIKVRAHSEHPPGTSTDKQPSSLRQPDAQAGLNTKDTKSYHLWIDHTQDSS
jgi:hypothetical protein